MTDTTTLAPGTIQTENVDGENRRSVLRRMLDAIWRLSEIKKETDTRPFDGIL